MQGTIQTTWRHGDPSVTQAFLSKGVLNVPFDSVRKPVKERVTKHDVTKARPKWRKGNPVTINGVKYDSVAHASSVLNVAVDTLRFQIRKAGSRDIKYTRVYRISELANQELMIDGVKYSDIHAASYLLKASCSLLLNKINKAQSFTFSHRVRKNSIPVIINGVKYDSVTLAVERTNLSYKIVQSMAKQQNAK